MIGYCDTQSRIALQCQNSRIRFHLTWQTNNQNCSYNRQNNWRMLEERKTEALVPELLSY